MNARLCVALLAIALGCAAPHEQLDDLESVLAADGAPEEVLALVGEGMCIERPCVESVQCLPGCACIKGTCGAVR